jgi:hypothetical protein
MAKKSIFAWIPEDLHRELKAKLSQEGRTIQDFVQQAVQAYLKEGKK